MDITTLQKHLIHRLVTTALEPSVRGSTLPDAVSLMLSSSIIELDDTGAIKAVQLADTSYTSIQEAAAAFLKPRPYLLKDSTPNPFIAPIEPVSVPRTSTPKVPVGKTAAELRDAGYSLEEISNAGWAISPTE